jgi:UDP-N-acetylglucosamine 1-carboxyvinyltransferase
MNQASALIISPSPELTGSITLSGAKNAVLVSIAATLLASGRNILRNVPDSEDVAVISEILRVLGAVVTFDKEAKQLVIDTSNVQPGQVPFELMRAMRASVLIAGPLLARYGKAFLCLPGGDFLGRRPIDFHERAFCKMGAQADEEEGITYLTSAGRLRAARHVLEYPSVGATENILMASVLTPGTSTIINAALEPEVMDLITMLRGMGAQIECHAPATLVIHGVDELKPADHAIMADRLEAGTYLIAAAMTGGALTITNAPACMDVVLEKLAEMGHDLQLNNDGSVHLRATASPRAVSFKTMPYPGFPTDLQAPMLAAQCLAEGECEIWELVWEQRFHHVPYLQKMGADIAVNGCVARIKGGARLQGAHVAATDIRAGAALVLAGLAAHEGETYLTQLRHLARGYDHLLEKMSSLGARIKLVK